MFNPIFPDIPQDAGKIDTKSRFMRLELTIFQERDTQNDTDR
jgi:hypothetical protein